MRHLGTYHGKDFCCGLSHHPQDAAQINKALEDIGGLADDLQKSTHDHIFNSQPFQVLFEQSEECMEHLRNTNGLLSAFWLLYIDLVELMLHMIHASRRQLDVAPCLHASNAAMVFSI